MASIEKTPSTTRGLLVEDTPSDVALVRLPLTRKASRGTFEITSADTLHSAVEALGSGTTFDIVLRALDLPDGIYRFQSQDLFRALIKSSTACPLH